MVHRKTVDMSNSKPTALLHRLAVPSHAFGCLSDAISLRVSSTSSEGRTSGDAVDSSLSRTSEWRLASALPAVVLCGLVASIVELCARACVFKEALEMK